MSLATLDDVCADIARCAADLEVSIAALSRRTYTQNGVLSWSYERFGSWSAVKRIAADRMGQPSHGRELMGAAQVRKQASYIGKLERDLGWQQLIWNELHGHVVQAVTGTSIKLASRPKPKPRKQKQRALVALLSDLHFGAIVGAETLGNAFNSDVARDRMRILSDQIRTWKEHRRDDTDLVVCLAGDILEGVIHYDADVEPLVKQWNDARVILTEFLDEVTSEFKSTRIICLPGNHDRTTYRGGQRALSLRWDSHAHTLYHALQATFRDHKNIAWDVPDSGVGQYHTPGGELIVFNHGDVGLTFGSAAKSFSLDKLSQKVERWEAAGVFDRPIAAACIGHYHTPLTLTLNTKARAELIINGSLKGPDAYAQNALGIPGGGACQIIFESTESHAVGDVRKCVLS